MQVIIILMVNLLTTVPEGYLKNLKPMQNIAD